MRLEPLRQRRLRLVSQPQPGELDQHASQPRIAGLGHALLALDTAAAPRRRRKSRIGGKLAAVGEVPVKSLRPENGRKVGAHRLQGQQHRHRIRRRRLTCKLSGHSQQRILLGLHSLDLLEQKFEPIELTADLRLQMRRQLSSVPGAQGLKPRPPIAPQRRVFGDALGEQKALDPVHMRDPLGDQCLALATKPAAVLFLGRGRNHHRADPWLAALVGQKSPQQRLAIEPVRLGAPSPSRRRDRGGIDHVALNAFLLQNAVQPEPIQPRLLDRDDQIGLARLGRRLALQVRKQLHQLSNVTSREAALGHLLALAGRQRRHQPHRTAQFQRYKNCAKLCADSGRSVGTMIEQHCRLQVEWFCNLSLASDLVAIHSPWNLRRFAPRNDEFGGGLLTKTAPSPRRRS